MNNRIKNLIKNISYTLTSNLISMVISAVIILIIPKLIGVEEYGYWQLYLFYSSYVGFLQFGWNDGIYLRYGGKEYKDLDKQLFFSQFCMLVLLQLIILIIICMFSNIFLIDNNKLFIYIMTALCMFFVNVKGMLLYILQGTNRIREYAKITMIDRVIYLIIIIILILAGIREYKLMIIADLLGKFISLILSMYYCLDFILKKMNTFYFTFTETIENVSVGIKLMFSNIASMLIIGVVRFGIEFSWNVATFAKVSLVLSISNFLMSFINAIGIVMFTVIRRTNKKKLSNVYSIMRDFLMIILFAFLIVYYPVKEIISLWLPKYSDSLKYMTILFPMCIYEGKMSLLINTYLKSLRKEKLILKVNLITLFISVILTFISTYVMKDLDFAIISIVLLLAFRCILSELYLSKSLKIVIYKDIILELLMTTVFIISGWYIESWITVLVYGVNYIIYIFIKKKDIKNTVKNLKILINNS